MVKITNGVDVIEVTAGAFNTIYKRQGYELVDGVEDDVIEVTDEEDQKPSEDEHAEDGKDINDSDDASEGDQNVSEDNADDAEKDDEFADLITKPVSQWSKEEMQKYVKANDIDTSKAKNVAEAKKIIAEYIDSIQ